MIRELSIRDYSLLTMFQSKTRKKIILVVASIFLIAGFFFIPPYNKWLTTRLVPYWKDFVKQRNKLDIEHRKQERFGYFYSCCKQMTAPFAKMHDKEKILLLMPPTAYFKKAGINYETCEPGIFYYLTDIRTVPATSSNALKANWYIRVKDKRIIVDTVIDVSSLRDTIEAMKKTTVAL
jgi:hypothetical protein